MRLLFLVLALVPSSKQALTRAAAAILLAGALMAAGSTGAQAVECTDKKLPHPGMGQDIVIDKECRVGDGLQPYNYGNVNIVAGGRLIFEEKADKVRVHFWAKSILVENGGSLIAGSAGACGGIGPSSSGPFGCKGGVLTIHLYGEKTDPPQPGAGIICKSNNSQDDPPCGIDKDPWDNGADKKFPLFGAKDDYFYKYDSLPFDDGKTGTHLGYFGYKVLAVSYGGTLQLFGKKGAVYGTEPKAQDSGRSWVRLMGTILGEQATSLKVDNPVNNPIDWEVGDHIVVTTTDYLASHSEELVICSIAGNTIGFTADLTANPPDTCPVKGVQWTHNGEQFALSRLQTAPAKRLKINKTAAETRAAVGLLTRSIRIVSEGKAYNTPLPPANDPSTDRYFGGHTIARQGFKLFQVQGVEFKQLGQGGRLGHYPLHFHMARWTPPTTFVKDSSINESMTRWITVHATQGVTLKRNVGYLSIGHGFYLEDAVETDNKFYSNLGIFARAAVINDQNPRKVPGILASPDDTPGVVKFGSDKDTPSVFWITNGWNDFQGNMAAGAGLCGVCYWEIPASISGPSQPPRKWESYASEQTPGRFGTSPLMNFDGNYCTAAMVSFQTVGYTAGCPGVGPPFNSVLPVKNENAPASGATKPPECGPGTKAPICAAGYYPNINNGELNHATQCPDTGPCTEPAVSFCENPGNTEDQKKNCKPTVINNYTTSFNYAQYNFSAVWLRHRWHLISNSFISDVQNAGLTFVGGGDYTRSSAISGLWNLALKNVFVGETQPTDKAHAFASVLSPFNADALKQCDNTANRTLYCMSVNNSFNLLLSNFGVSQHMFNIYDGPADEDSNAYLDIKKTDLKATNSNMSVPYTNLIGIPQAVKLDPKETLPVVPVGDCYIQNAAIAWKQPNGFYYPPTFHSNNLFFDKVDIRHYVIVPQFIGNTYNTQNDPSGSPPVPGAKARYCNPLRSLDMFNGFSAIDRQTVLTDDDGSLTGYWPTISVNEDKFFTAPIDGIECQTDGATPETGTARTSPYDYVTTVVYPETAQKPLPPPDPPPPPFNVPNCNDPDWNSDCTSETCFGVPFYRLYQTGTETTAKKPPEFIRMAGFNLCQRQTMSVNHGSYYVDLTASKDTQSKWVSGLSFCPAPPPFPQALPGRCINRNIFKGGKTYDFFHVHATKDTEQTFQMFVGPGLNKMTDVKLIRVNIDTAPLVISDGTGDASTLKVEYNEPNGPILKVTLNHKFFASQYASAKEAQCVPNLFCKLTGQTSPKKCTGNDNVTGSDQDIACGYAGKDVDCPTGGCVGFSVKLPGGFVASDQTTKMNIPTTLATCFPKVPPWNVPPKAATQPIAGAACFNAPMNLAGDFCK